MDVLRDERPVTGDVERQETQAMLERCIAALPDELKEVFLLRAVECLSHDDVARILRSNPATVRTHYRRARLILQKKVGILLTSDSTRAEKENDHEMR